ncbi:integrase [Pseudovibrio japonicus]|uniref:Integrase n=1 Tax=Pseudovibrio japonicus TaxID=366534 RepID=A0ABQ3EGU2_9HYPH|nr:site-specific integrase [Pseudovibrio japonicus]GHB33657.1 integrase [Pseudovibrio japonicus]
MSVYRPKDKKGKYKSQEFHYDFQYKGRRYYGSTEKTTKREAEKVEARLREELKTPKDTTTIDGAFDNFWEEKAQHYSEPKAVSWRLEQLQDNLSEILDQDRVDYNLSEIKTRHLARYVSARRSQPNKRGHLPQPATINRELSLLRTIFNYANDVWELEITVPNFKAVMLEEPDARIVEVTADDQAKIKEHMREDFHDALDFLILAGPRASNALVGKGIVLTADAVDFDHMQITFQVKSKKPGGRRIVIPITGPMATILANNIGNHEDSVFTYVARRTIDGRQRGARYPLQVHTFRREFKAAAEAIGKPKLRVHDLRHTAATRTLRVTGNLRVAQKLLGHTRSTTTEKYAHLMTDDFATQMEMVHSGKSQTDKKSRNITGTSQTKPLKVLKKRRK